MTVTFQVGDREFGGAGNLEIDFWVGAPLSRALGGATSSQPTVTDSSTLQVTSADKPLCFIGRRPNERVSIQSKSHLLRRLFFRREK